MQISSFIPAGLRRVLRPYYHGALALLSSWRQGRPSRRLVVVGVTGTAGKSTTVQLLAHILTLNGVRAGYVTTAGFSDGATSTLNEHGLSMPGGPLLQRQLKEIADAGCRAAVIECTSEGLAQNRHLGIAFDVALFTNISAAHLEAHGGFAPYLSAKQRLFSALSGSPVKAFWPRKVAGVNADDEQAEAFLKAARVPERFAASFHAKSLPASTAVHGTLNGDGFELGGQQFTVRIPGEFNRYNALLAAAASTYFGVPPAGAARAVATFTGVAGRMETVISQPFRVLVDYAPEPVGMEAALSACRANTAGRLIHVFGSTGGHRDVSKRAEFGKISARYSDLIVITNDDVYGSDPEKIANDIAVGIEEQRKHGARVTQVEKVLDRRSAVRRALALASPGDTVIFTGKGSEQFLVLPGDRRIPWDERNVVREEFVKLTQAK